MPTKPASGTSLNTGHSLASGMLHFWAMLEGTGTTTADSKSSLTGTLTGGPTWTSDSQGAGLTAFTSSNHVQSATSSIGFTDPDTLTYMCRVTTPSDVATRRVIYSPNRTSGGNVPELCLSDGIISGGIDIIIPGVFVATGEGSIAGNTTYTLGYTRSGAGNTHKFYKDGSLLSNYNTTGGESTSFANPTDKRVIGARDDAGTSPFTGQIWWMAVWDRALSGAEVASMTTDPFVVFAPAAPSDTNLFYRRRR